MRPLTGCDIQICCVSVILDEEDVLLGTVAVLRARR